MPSGTPDDTPVATANPQCPELRIPAHPLSDPNRPRTRRLHRDLLSPIICEWGSSPSTAVKGWLISGRTDGLPGSRLGHNRRRICADGRQLSTGSHSGAEDARGADGASQIMLRPTSPGASISSSSTGLGASLRRSGDLRLANHT